MIRYISYLSSAIAVEASDEVGEVGEIITLCNEGVLEVEPSESEWWSTCNGMLGIC